MRPSRMFIGQRSENWVFRPTVLPTVGLRGLRGGPTKHQVLGALRPTVGNTVGLTTRFSGSYPVSVDVESGLPGSARWGPCVRGVSVNCSLSARTVSGVRPCWKLEEPKGPKGHPLDTHCEPSALHCWIFKILHCPPKGHRGFAADPVYGRAKCLPMLGEIKT